MIQIQSNRLSWCLPVLCYGLHLAAVIAGAGEFVYSGFARANLTVDGTASVTPDGLLELTTGAVSNQVGHAFHPTALRLRWSPDGKREAVRSFSASFVFGIVPLSPRVGGHGIALAVAPTKDLSSGHAGAYLGLLNSTNSSDANHIFAVELDTIANTEFLDTNNNHVGININSLKSANASVAGYWDDNTGEFKNLTLVSGEVMQVWLDYGEDTTLINVMLAPAARKKPAKPLVSARFDLSRVITNEAYIGFSSSTATLSSRHYVLGWSFAVGRPAPAIDMAKLPKLPNTGRSSKSRSQSSKTMVIVLPVVSMVLVLILLGAALLLVLRLQYRYVELREDWEVEFGAHRISYKDLIQATERFKNKNLLGVGGFGRVYKGVLPSSGMEVAVKLVSHESRQGLKEFVAEVASIGRLRHRNLVQLLGYCRLKDELLLVYDYMPNGSLDKYLYGHDEEPGLSWPQRFRIIKGVAAGLLYLHEEWEQVVVHRDIKASNVLLDGEMNARLGDFGLAKLYNHGAELHTTGVAGTFGYMAPELALTGRSSPLTDVFAFGAFLLEVAAGQRPIEQDVGGRRLMLVDWVFEHWRQGSLMEVADPRLQGEYDADEVSLALRTGLLCSQPVSSARPSMRQVMQYLDRDIPVPELTETQLSFSVLALMQSQGFDSYASSSSMKSLGAISNLSTGRCTSA